MKDIDRNYAEEVAIKKEEAAKANADYWLDNEMTSEDLILYIELVETQRRREGYKTDLAGIDNIVAAIRDYRAEQEIEGGLHD